MYKTWVFISYGFYLSMKYQYLISDSYIEAYEKRFIVDANIASTMSYPIKNLEEAYQWILEVEGF